MKMLVKQDLLFYRFKFYKDTADCVISLPDVTVYQQVTNTTDEYV